MTASKSPELKFARALEALARAAWTIVADADGTAEAAP